MLTPSIPDKGINSLVNSITKLDESFSTPTVEKLLKVDGQNTVEEERAILYSILRRVSNKLTRQVMLQVAH